MGSSKSTATNDVFSEYISQSAKLTKKDLWKTTALVEVVTSMVDFLAQITRSYGFTVLIKKRDPKYV